MALELLAVCREGRMMDTEKHPFVDRVRAERAIIAAVNRCRDIIGVELAGTSEKAIADWFSRIGAEMRGRDEVGGLRLRLEQAGRATRLASSGSHRGAMIADRVRAEAFEEAVASVEQAVVDVLRVAPKSA